MPDEPILVQRIPKPADRNANKPVYIMKVEDPTEKDGVAYFKVTNIIRGAYSVDIRGFHLSKAQADKLGKNPSVEIKSTTSEVHVEFPWHRVISNTNITYKKAQKGKENE